MNKPRKALTIEECKIQASILLKSARSPDSAIAKQAEQRLRRLPEFTQLGDIKLKHALNIIAIEQGFKSWVDLKLQMRFIIGGFLNYWFATYAEAKKYQQSSGGFLLPYKNQFFICEANYIKQIGWDPEDQDWQLIGWDWQQPKDPIARDRLYKKLLKNRGN